MLSNTKKHVLTFVFFSFTLLHGMNAKFSELSNCPINSLPTDVEKEIMSHYFEGPNQALAVEIFQEKRQNTEDTSKNLSFNKCIDPIASYYASKTDKDKKQSVDLGSLYVLQNLHTIKDLSKINQKADYYRLFNLFGPTKQEAFIDHLYEKKYSSPLWEKIPIETRERFDDFKSPSKTILRAIENWATQDPAAQLYAKLHSTQANSPDKENKIDNMTYQSNQGLGVRLNSGGHNIHHIQKTAHGRTDLPLVCKLTPEACQIIVQSDIKTIHPIDIAHLQKTNQKLLKFYRIDRNATIAHELFTLNNTSVVFHVMPTSIKEYIKKMYHYDLYSHRSCQRTYYSYPANWRSKMVVNAIAKTTMIYTTLYLMRKYLWPMCTAVLDKYDKLNIEARQNAFDTTIKPQLTADTIAAIQVHTQVANSELPSLLTENITPLNNPVYVDVESLKKAHEIINQTKNIQRSNFIANQDINNPLHIYNFFAYSGTFYTWLASLLWLPVTSTVGLFTSPMDCKNYNKLSCIKKIFVAPTYLFHDLKILAISIFKPNSLHKYIKPNLMITVPKNDS